MAKRVSSKQFPQYNGPPHQYFEFNNLMIYYTNICDVQEIFGKASTRFYSQGFYYSTAILDLFSREKCDSHVIA